MEKDPYEEKKTNFMELKLELKIFLLDQFRISLNLNATHSI